MHSSLFRKSAKKSRLDKGSNREVLLDGILRTVDKGKVHRCGALDLYYYKLGSRVPILWPPIF